jgi:hypothetical protein
VRSAMGDGEKAVVLPQPRAARGRWVGPEGAELAGVEEAEEERQGHARRVAGLRLEED